MHGCRQELHADVPQGPWSFVYSLTDNAGFTGGDTLLLRRAVLNYWNGFDDQRALECDDLVWRILETSLETSLARGAPKTGAQP